MSMSVRSIKCLLKSWGVKEPPVRPPWAHLPDPIFTDDCVACGECVAACPQEIIVVDPMGFPEVDFTRGHCTFCAACVTACTHGILQIDHVHESGPWFIGPEFGEACLAARGIACRICAQGCGERAIVFRAVGGGRKNPMVSDSACTGCGACVRFCPAGAIRMTHPAENGVR